MDKSKPAMSMLDIFVLYLMRDGVSTLYRLKKEAGISIGAASPSLRRLKDTLITRRAEFERKAVPGKRGKLEYMPNLFSSDFFQSDWISAFEANLPKDIESVARLVAIAESENRPDLAKKALNHAIEDRRKRPLQPASGSGRSRIASRYQSIMRAIEAARLKAEAAALKKILSDLQ